LLHVANVTWHVAMEYCLLACYLLSFCWAALLIKLLVLRKFLQLSIKMLGLGTVALDSHVGNELLLSGF